MTDSKQESKPLHIVLKKGTTESQALAEVQVEPNMRNAWLTSIAAHGVLSAGSRRPDFDDTFNAVNAAADAAKRGDLDQLSVTMACQITSLDAIYTDLARRSLLNLGEHPEAAFKLMGLALKAQSNARATAEALARIHQPREQTVIHKHVHVGAHGQAIVAEEFHSHGPGVGNAGIDHQPHAAGAALPRPNEIRHTLPVAESARSEALPNARRGKRERCADRQQQCAETRPQVSRGSDTKGDAQGSVTAVNTARKQRERRADR